MSGGRQTLRIVLEQPGSAQPIGVPGLVGVTAMPRGNAKARF